MSSYKALLAQRDELERKIEEARETEVSSALATIKSLVSEFGFTEADVFGRQRRTQKGSRSFAESKYRDPETGATWSGRCTPPHWIAGKNRKQFAI